MTTNISFSPLDILTPQEHRVVLLSDRMELEQLDLSEDQKEYAKSVFQKKEKAVCINLYSHFVFLALVSADLGKEGAEEKVRQLGADICGKLNEHKLEQVEVDGSRVPLESLNAFLEGLALKNYQFLKYFSDSHKKENALNAVGVFAPNSDINLEELAVLVEGVFVCRDWVNEPVIELDAIEIAARAKELGEQVGLKVDVKEEEEIKELGMGGLLAVNAGSVIPPTFTVCEWKPEATTNERPIILVGKGVVYDTGGLSLKPTPNSMDLMKSDMGGAATVFASIYTAARLNLPLWIIALIPATDNRPGGNAVTPGDVIEMYNGKTVEVKNTDAEGRLILADGLSFGGQFNPELIMTFATLTGAAAYSIGPPAAVMMGDAEEGVKGRMKEAGTQVHERLVEFPFWSDYDEEIKSDIADLSNLGGSWGGAITAGKFLKAFTDFPYIHVDIAGPCFLPSEKGYLPKGGSGYGVRLLIEFFKNYTND